MADRALRFDLLGRDKSLSASLGKAEHRLGRFRSTVAKAGVALTGAFAAGGAVAGLKSAVMAAAGFDKTIRQVAAVAKVPAAAMKELRKVALDMGASTSFSAKQASEAMLALGKGGLSFAAMKAGALKSTLTLAAAGGLELGSAAEFIVQGLKTFGLQANKAGDVAAALAGAANASTAGVEDMGMALAQVGAGARNARMSISQTTAVLGLFADNGVKGSDAGTSLKTMLARLVPTTKEARDAMADLGLKFTDAKGAILPISDIADQLQDKLGKLSDAQRTTALATIFGSDATRAATILMRSGSEGLAKYIKATQDRAAAEKMAKTNTEGASGAFERLQGAIETVSIRIGDKLLPAAASVAEGFGKVIVDALDTLEARVDVKVFVSAAKAWVTVLIREFKKALKDGDWGDFGDTLGNVLKKGIGNGADVIDRAFSAVDWNKLGTTLGDGLAKAVGNGSDLLKRAFGKVDWTEIGKTIGSHAFGFAVGFISALGTDLFTVAREHPVDLVIFLSSFLAIGKIGGIVGRLLAKVPILRMFAPMLGWFDKLTAPMTSRVGRFLGFLGKGLLEGLERVFPRAAGMVRRGLQDMLAWFALRAEAFRDGGARMVKRLAVGIGEQIGLVAKNLASLVRTILRPFVGIGRWLIDEGVALVRGLLEGVGSRLGAVGSRMREVIGKVTSPFKGALRWLSNAGQNIVDGLVSGMRSALGGVGDIVRDLKDAIVGGIKRLFGIRSPSTVMAGLGGHMVAGLVRGLVSERGVLQAILKSLGADVMEFFAGQGGGSARGLIGAALGAFGAFKDLFPGMTIGGWRARGSVPGSDHPKGKALDLMTNSGAVAAMIISIFRSMMGAKYWIWNRQIASSPSWNTRPYHGPNPHTDHVHLSFFRKGGIAGLGGRGPVAGIFGEAGPEALVPLDRARGLGGGPAVVVNLHFHGPVVGGQRVADEFAGMIHEALKRRKRDVFGGRALGIA